MKNEINMLEGPLAGKILLFALPLAATGVLQQLFNSADVIVIGQFVGKEAMAAVGSNSAFIGLMVNLFIGISLGTNVVIAKYTGQKEPDQISKAVHTSIMVAVLGGLFLTIFGEIIINPLLHLLGVPNEIFSLARVYLRIYLIGMPVILLYNFESAIFRSQGNTKIPLICLTVSGCINVVLNLFFVLVMHLSVAGVAIATVISNVVSSSLLFILLSKSQSLIQVHFKQLRIHTDILKEICRIGLPAGLQGMVFSFSNIIIQSAINSLGATIMAASSAAFNIEVIVYYFVNSFGQASTTFIGQNYGAGKMDRCIKATRWTLALDMLFTGILSIVIVTLSHSIIALFNTNPQVIHYGSIRLYCIVGFECINVLMEIFSGSMRGYGNSLVPAIITLIGVVGSRIAWVYTIFASHHTFDTLMMIYPISWIITAIGLIIAYVCYKRKLLQPKNA